MSVESNPNPIRQQDQRVQPNQSGTKISLAPQEVISEAKHVDMVLIDSPLDTISERLEGQLSLMRSDEQSHIKRAASELLGLKDFDSPTLNQKLSDLKKNICGDKFSLSELRSLRDAFIKELSNQNLSKSDQAKLKTVANGIANIIEYALDKMSEKLQALHRVLPLDFPKKHLEALDLLSQRSLGPKDLEQIAELRNALAKLVETPNLKFAKVIENCIKNLDTALDLVKPAPRSQSKNAEVIKLSDSLQALRQQILKLPGNKYDDLYDIVQLLGDGSYKHILGQLNILKYEYAELQKQISQLENGAEREHLEKAAAIVQQLISKVEPKSVIHTSSQEGTGGLASLHKLPDYFSTQDIDKAQSILLKTNLSLEDIEFLKEFKERLENLATSSSQYKLLVIGAIQEISNALPLQTSTAHLAQSLSEDNQLTSILSKTIIDHNDLEQLETLKDQLSARLVALKDNLEGIEAQALQSQIKTIESILMINDSARSLQANLPRIRRLGLDKDDIHPLEHLANLFKGRINFTREDITDIMFNYRLIENQLIKNPSSEEDNTKNKVLQSFLATIITIVKEVAPDQIKGFLPLEIEANYDPKLLFEGFESVNTQVLESENVHPEVLYEKFQPPVLLDKLSDRVDILAGGKLGEIGYDVFIILNSRIAEQEIKQLEEFREQLKALVPSEGERAQKLLKVISEALQYVDTQKSKFQTYIEFLISESQRLNLSPVQSRQLENALKIIQEKSWSNPENLAVLKDVKNFLMTTLINNFDRTIDQTLISVINEVNVVLFNSNSKVKVTNLDKLLLYAGNNELSSENRFLVLEAIRTSSQTNPAESLQKIINALKIRVPSENQVMIDGLKSLLNQVVKQPIRISPKESRQFVETEELLFPELTRFEESTVSSPIASAQVLTIAQELLPHERGYNVAQLLQIPELHLEESSIENVVNVVQKNGPLSKDDVQLLNDLKKYLAIMARDFGIDLSKESNDPRKPVIIKAISEMYKAVSRNVRSDLDEYIISFDSSTQKSSQSDIKPVQTEVSDPDSTLIPSKPVEKLTQVETKEVIADSVYLSVQEKVFSRIEDRILSLNTANETNDLYKLGRKIQGIADNGTIDTNDIGILSILSDDVRRVLKDRVPQERALLEQALGVVENLIRFYEEKADSKPSSSESSSSTSLKSTDIPVVSASEIASLVAPSISQREMGHVVTEKVGNKKSSYGEIQVETTTAKPINTDFEVAHILGMLKDPIPKEFQEKVRNALSTLPINLQALIDVTIKAPLSRIPGPESQLRLALGKLVDKIQSKPISLNEVTVPQLHEVRFVGNDGAVGVHLARHGTITTDSQMLQLIEHQLMHQPELVKDGAFNMFQFALNQDNLSEMGVLYDRFNERTIVFEETGGFRGIDQDGNIHLSRPVGVAKDVKEVTLNALLFTIQQSEEGEQRNLASLGQAEQIVSPSDYANLMMVTGKNAVLAFRGAKANAACSFSGDSEQIGAVTAAIIGDTAKVIGKDTLKKMMGKSSILREIPPPRTTALPKATKLTKLSFKFPKFRAITRIGRGNIFRSRPKETGFATETFSAKPVRKLKGDDRFA